jgi:hypothetical protein
MSGDFLETWMTVDGRKDIQAFAELYSDFLSQVLTDQQQNDNEVDLHERLALVFYGKEIRTREEKTAVIMDSEAFSGFDEQKKTFFIEVLINYENSSNILFGEPQVFRAPALVEANYTPRNISKKGFKNLTSCLKELKNLEMTLHTE